MKINNSVEFKFSKDLVEYDSAASTGFEKEEGYSAPEPQGELPFDTESDDDDDDDF